MTFKVVGHSVPKPDAIAKVTGAAQYTADLTPPVGCLHIALVRSPYPHARVTSIDTSAAERLPGVKAMMDYRNCPQNRFTTADGDVFETIPRDQVLFDSVVRYVGEPVLAIAATDPAVARAARDLVTVEYDQLPAVFDPVEAMDASSPLVLSESGSNLIVDLDFPEQGNVAQALQAADIVIEHRFRTGRQKHAQMETFSCVASVDSRGKLTVWSPTQVPGPLRVMIARWLAMPAGKVRIITPFIGGAFGGRLGFTGEQYVVAMAMHTKRPCRMEFDRTEDLLHMESRHPFVMDITLGAKKDGTITAMRATTYANAGPYVTCTVPVLATHGGCHFAPYNIPNVKFTGKVVRTNAPVAGPFRGYGAIQGHFAAEQMIDLVAEACGLDPADVRLRNTRREGDLSPFTLQPMAVSFGAEVINRGVQAMGWRDRHSRPKADGPWRYGSGMSFLVWISGVACIAGQHENSGAIMRMNLDGSFDLITGAIDIGTGAHTTLAQVAAEEIGVPLEMINVGANDTDVVPFDQGPRASRTLFVAGQAVRAAARAARERVLQRASTMLEAAPEDLEIQDAQVQVAGAPGRSVSLARVALTAIKEGDELITQAEAPQNNAESFGAQFVDVAVNVETGQIRLERVLAVHDIGRAINPTIVEGQIEGGLFQGIGFTLSEEMVVDPQTGSPMNLSFMDYKILTADDLPKFETILVEGGDGNGPFGAKGVGEIGLVPIPGAIANAVADAIGVRLFEAPLTPERVLRALQSRN